MTVAVMQPYWAPYAGYFRLFTAADVVVMFDCVQFIRRGWIHRRRDGGGWVTLPVQKAPRETRICDMRLRDGADLTAVVCSAIANYIAVLGIQKPMPRSSTMAIDPGLRAQSRVISICQHLGATRYVNPSGGRALYDHDAFAAAGIELRFLPAYTGSYESIATRLTHESAASIREEIIRETTLEP